MCIFITNFKMKTAVIFISYLLHITTAGGVKVTTFCMTGNVQDYYWREYTGVIPHDAVRGGTDRTGLPTYIGQAMIYPWGQLPASIYHGNKSAVASANLKTYYANKNVKILCSGSREKFKWIQTNIDKINVITDCHLILGGVDNGYQENIGRVNYNEEIILGKVIRKPLAHDGLWVPDNGTETKFTHFEVLAFDCKSNLDIFFRRILSYDD